SWNNLEGASPVWNGISARGERLRFQFRGRSTSAPAREKTASAWSGGSVVARMQRQAFIALLPLFGTILGWGASATPLPGNKTPSIILISIDTLRADRLSCYGYTRIRTPHLDALTTSGTRFSAIESPVPLTFPAHVSLFTSTYPFFNGIEDNGEALGSKAVTLAAILKSRGYYTGAVVGGFVLD